MSTPTTLTAVVLAGGESRRFGSDKLAAVVDGGILLDRTLEGLPEDAAVIVVGPERRLARRGCFVREDPPGGGPAAAMVTGLQQALGTDAEQILVLPGDAPHAGHAAVLLLRVLLDSPGATAVVGTDRSGFDQPLQLALTRAAAEELVAAAGPEGARGGSARALVNRLVPPARRWRLATEAHWDVDTPEQLLAWQERDSPAVRAILAALDGVQRSSRPAVVALDGRSGAGKSTLAAALALARPATVLEGDDFYSPELVRMGSLARGQLTDAGVAERVIDWRRLRAEALEPRGAGRSATFARYDWDADDGRLGERVTLEPSDLVVVEGVYSARPELADLVDLAVHVDVAPELRARRLAERSADPDGWVTLWERGEAYYFGSVRPPETFDLRVATTTA